MNAIETHELTREFHQHTAVDRLSLSIEAGCVFGFLGPNGAGKTTTIRMLSALIEPTSGSASIAGFTLGKQNEDIRRSIGILTETPGLYDKLSAMQNLIFFGQLYDLSPKEAASQAERYLRDLDLWDRRNDKVGGFSKGMRQKLAIVRALLHEPQVIFLDEPTSGLDPEASRTVRDFVKSLRAEGRTIILTTHNLPEADELCDLVGIFRVKMIRIDTPKRLRANLFERGVKVSLLNDANQVLPTVKQLPFVKGFSTNNGSISLYMDDPDRDSPTLVSALLNAGGKIRSVEPIEHSLEDVYLQLMGDIKATNFSGVSK